MRKVIIAFALSLAATQALAQGKEPIALRDMGSFHIGGRHIEITGQPIKEVVFTPGGVPAKVDPNGTYQVEQMYVQYFLAQNPKGKLPLLLWHGGGLTGVTYETKPDGGEGWLTYFMRKGWDTYISDAMERGRSGWTPTFRAIRCTLPLGDPWERFRVGPIGSWNADKAKRVTYPGTQFPIEAYEQFMKQGVPRWLTTDDAIVAAYIELIDKVCPCVVLVHSQSGSFGFKALEARPDKVKALVAVEPTLRRRQEQGRVDQEYAGGHDLRRQRQGPSALVEDPPGRRRLRGRAQGRRRQRRRDRPAGRRHQGQFAHGDDGQEQQPGRRSHPEMAGRQGAGGVTPATLATSARSRPTPAWCSASSRGPS